MQSCVGKYFHFTRVSASRYQELWAQLCTVNAHRCNNNSNYVAQCYHEIMVGSFSGYSKILIKPRIIFQALHNFKIININRRASNCWIKFYAKQKKVKMCERKNRKLRIVYIVCVCIYIFKYSLVAIYTTSYCYFSDFWRFGLNYDCLDWRCISSLSFKRIKWHSAMVESSSLRVRNNPITSSSHPVKTSENKLAFLLLVVESTKSAMWHKERRDNYRIHPISNSR